MRLPGRAAGPFEEKNKKEEEAMASYKCNICGYVYNPEEGDPDADIAGGTAFKDLPDSWVCPMCGAPKTEFEKVG
jgi:rubredoxin